MTQVVYERSKRSTSSSSSSSSSSDSDDSSSSSDSSSSDSDDMTAERDDITTTASDDITTESDSTTPVDECALLGDFIESDLAAVPVDDVGSLFNYTIIVQTTRNFFQLLTSAPMLFANLSLAVDTASDQFMVPPSYLEDPNIAAFGAVAELSADFVALANDSCGIALSENQTVLVDAFFQFVLPFFVVLSQECNLINVTIIEESMQLTAPTTTSTLR